MRRPLPISMLPYQFGPRKSEAHRLFSPFVFVDCVISQWRVAEKAAAHSVPEGPLSRGRVTSCSRERIL